jgi:hypothetical protein
LQIQAKSQAPQRDQDGSNDALQGPIPAACEEPEFGYEADPKRPDGVDE